MSLYAIGDLHLHFGSVLKATHQRTDPLWKHHEQKFRLQCMRLLQPQDTLVLCGDHSWGRNLSEAEPDLEYITTLPGRKILLRGNHDMFWDSSKTQMLNERYQGRLFFLQNSFLPYGEYAITGTKGFTFEGPFYLDQHRRIIGWDQDAEAHAQKIIRREAERLRISLDAAQKAGYTKKIMFLHYPPTCILEHESIFTRLAEAYSVEKVFYAHCHGAARFHDSIEGTLHGIEYQLISGDYLKWQPWKIF